MASDKTTKLVQQRFPLMQSRMVREGMIGITICCTEYVMPVMEADELVGMILRAKRDGVQPNAE